MPKKNKPLQFPKRIYGTVFQRFLRSRRGFGTLRAERTREIGVDSFPNLEAIFIENGPGKIRVGVYELKEVKVIEAKTVIEEKKR